MKACTGCSASSSSARRPVLSNSEGYRSRTLADRIAAAVLGIEITVSDLDIPPSELERLAGSFELTDAGVVMEVWGEEGRLFAQATGQPRTRLRLQPDGDYRPDFDDSVRLVFEEGDPAPGFVLHQGGMRLTAKRVESEEVDP